MKRSFKTMEEAEEYVSRNWYIEKTTFKVTQYGNILAEMREDD